MGGVIVDRRWSEGGGDSRFLLLGEKISSQLEVEELFPPQDT